MNKKLLVYVTIALLAGAGLVAQQMLSRANKPPVVTIEAIFTVTEPSSLTPTYEGCYFVWASRALPEISAQVQAGIQALQPEAQARAEAFGEDCVFADGHAEFATMETDFYVVLQVDNLSNTAELGNWIIEVMPIIDQLPREQVPGVQPGFVDFRFSQGETEFIFVRVPIERYRNEAQGKRGAELFLLFYENP